LRKAGRDYGFGLELVVVVESVLVDEFGVESEVLALVEVLVLVSFVFSVLVEGFTTVVLVSVFLSAPGAGATVSVFCSQAPRSAAPAKMQISFFIV
jgi:hypothetical protein